MLVFVWIRIWLKVINISNMLGYLENVKKYNEI